MGLKNCQDHREKCCHCLTDEGQEDPSDRLAGLTDEGQVFYLDGITYFFHYSYYELLPHNPSLSHSTRAFEIIPIA